MWAEVEAETGSNIQMTCIKGSIKSNFLCALSEEHSQM